METYPMIQSIVVYDLHQQNEVETKLILQLSFIISIDSKSASVPQKYFPATCVF